MSESTTSEIIGRLATTLYVTCADICMLLERRGRMKDAVVPGDKDEEGAHTWAEFYIELMAWQHFASRAWDVLAAEFPGAVQAHHETVVPAGVELPRPGDIVLMSLVEDAEEGDEEDDEEDADATPDRPQAPADMPTPIWLRSRQRFGEN